MKFLSGANTVNIRNVFDTSVYTGNGTTQDITTGVDLSVLGGLVWIKNTDALSSHVLTDTVQGAGNILSSNSAAATATDADTITAFGADGFSVGADLKANSNTQDCVSWTFRSSRRFFAFDTVVKSSGTDATVDLSVLSSPGMVIAKRTDSTGDWYVWHRELTSGKLLTFGAVTETTLGHMTVSGATVTLKDGVIADGSYVVYGFAHDIRHRGVVQCGEYTGNASATGPEIDLGWRPQFLVIKGKDIAMSWHMYDNQRNTSNPRNSVLMANLDSATLTGHGIDFTATGFQPKNSNNPTNGAYTYIYLAIREE